jgi:hypothetical protein
MSPSPPALRKASPQCPRGPASIPSPRPIGGSSSSSPPSRSRAGSADPSTGATPGSPRSSFRGPSPRRAWQAQSGAPLSRQFPRPSSRRCGCPRTPRTPAACPRASPPARCRPACSRSGDRGCALACPARVDADRRRDGTVIRLGLLRSPSSAASPRPQPICRELSEIPETVARRRWDECTLGTGSHLGRTLAEARERGGVRCFHRERGGGFEGEQLVRLPPG